MRAKRATPNAANIARCCGSLNKGGEKLAEEKPTEEKELTEEEKAWRELDETEHRWGDLLKEQIDAELTYYEGFTAVETARRKLSEDYKSLRGVGRISERIEKLKECRKEAEEWLKLRNKQTEARKSVGAVPKELEESHERIDALLKKVGVELG